MKDELQKFQLNINANDDILQLYCRASAPCRDYYGLIITPKYLLLNIWKITHGPHVTPKLKSCSINDFKTDKHFQETIKNCFGISIFQYIQELSNGQKKLENMPTKIFLHLLMFLRINDILKLMLCSKILFERCNLNNVWRLIFIKKFGRSPSKEENLLSLDYLWKEIYRKRLTYVLNTLKENNKKTEIKLPQKKEGRRNIKNSIKGKQID